MTGRLRFALAVVLLSVLSLQAEKTAEAADESTVALKTNSAWRCFFTWQDEMIQWDDGSIGPGNYVRKVGMKKAEGMPEMTDVPPADWMASDFNDGDWIASPAPFTHSERLRNLAVLYARGRFEVKNPAAVGEPTLTIAYRGGVVVYLNGKELTRSHMPAGKVTAATPAEIYPKENYVDDAGLGLNARIRRRQVLPDGIKKRLRKMIVTIPQDRLLQGVNTLAMEIHRAQTAQLYYTAKRTVRNGYYDWTMNGLYGVFLKGGAGLVPANVMTPGSVRIWAGHPIYDAWDQEPGEPGNKMGTVSIEAARNGRFSGVTMVRSAGPIDTLSVTPADLKASTGPGVIAAKNISIRHATTRKIPHARRPVFLKKPSLHYRNGAGPLAVLEDGFEAVRPPEGAASITQSIWATVTVPRDQPAGDYSGTLSVAANGQKAIPVPIRIHISDFVLPDPTASTGFVGLMESPESVALRYKVPYWSEAHWQHLDTVFSLLRRAGNKSVYIPLIAHTNMGNDESMVRWIKQADGYTHDFSVLERYLDLVAKHLGKIPVVCLYVWTPAHGGGAWGKGNKDAPAKNDKPMMFTLLDPKTGKTTATPGPDWGTPGSVPFWKPVLQGVMKRLKDRGLESSAAFGLLADYQPRKFTIDDVAATLPDLKWMVHAHGRSTHFAGKPVMLDAQVWGVRPLVTSESRYKRYGWKLSFFNTVFPRSGAGAMGAVSSTSPPNTLHALIEGYQIAGYSGVSRMGADFWPCVPTKRGGLGYVISRHSFKNRPGPPTLSNPALLYPGTKGPVATTRYALLCQGLQECEARIFMERALLAKKIDGGLAKRVQECLDDRVRVINRSKGVRGRGLLTGSLYYAHGYARRTRELYALAAEVSKKIAQ